MKTESDMSVWEKLQNTEDPIIMYGTGNGADKVMDKLAEYNISLSGVTASNGFVRKRTFRGFDVYPLSHFEEIYESFTVIVTFGTSVPEVMENIVSVAEKHRLLVPCVPVTGTEVFDRKFFSENAKKIEDAYSLMADTLSRKVYEGYIDFLYGGELSVLNEITTPENEAFENILKLSRKETYVDIGAYRGDTVDTFLKYCGNHYEKIICAEPDVKSFSKLTEHCKNLKNTVLFNAAVTDTDGEVGFNDAHGRQSSIGGTHSVRALTLNTLCENTHPTYIKIDSEGCENEILSVGSDILKTYSPKLNVAVYHKSADVFTVPLLINRINPDYKIYLRHHPYIPAWDTLVYCNI